MKKTFIYISIIIIIIILFYLLPSKTKTKENTCIPKITLKGQTHIKQYINTSYKEQGYKATCKNKNLTKKVTIKENLNTNKTGNYTINYTITYNNIKVTAQRYITILDKPFYKDTYEKIDNTTRGWWSGNKKDNTRPQGGADINELKKYNAYFMGPNKKTIYLTFDEGGNDTYIKQIVEVLNKNNVKATFFLCGQYLLDNQELIKHMVKTGHSIGNHTDNHYNMQTLATKENFNKFLKEIQTIENIYQKITGQTLDKIYREPRGEWSYRDLQIMKDLGYKTYFYSADYMDFKNDVSKKYALNELTKRHHNGAIYLIHPKNKGNYEALDTFIKEMKKLGYKFDLVKNI